MKAAYSAIWITLSLLIGFQQALIYVHFTLNRETIERRFCINKNRPELQCHGTCFLKKQLQKAGENPESASVVIYPWIDTFPSLATESGLKTPTIEVQNEIPGLKEDFYKEPGLETPVPPPVTGCVSSK